jgi:hypothetical protein
MVRECHRNRVEFPAVIILPDETTATGGNVEGDCDRAQRAQRSPWRWGAGGTAPEGGHRGERAGRGGGERGSPSRNGPTGRDHRGSAARSGGSRHGAPTGPHRPSICPPPHPSHPQPFAGGHTFNLKYPLSKIFCAKVTRQQIYLTSASL